MKAKILTLLALLLGLAVAQPAKAAGCLYEVLPCTQEGQTLVGPIASADAPLVTGETIYFKFRLKRTLAMKTASDTNKWRFKYCGGGTSVDQIVAELVTPLSVGIYVSGELRYATYVRQLDPGIDFTDFVFSYTTRPGDFALPIRLALNNGKPADEVRDAATQFVFLNRNIWDIVDDDGSPADITYSATFDFPSARPESGQRVTDDTLASAGFFVKSLDFDPRWEKSDTDPKYWRMVHSGSTITDSLLPQIVADAAPSNAVSLYVWSEDDTVVSVKDGVETEIITGYQSGVPVKKIIKVGRVTFAAGTTFKNFQLQGGAEEKVGQSTNLILSEFPFYSFNALNVRKDYFLKVPVTCTAPLPPTLIVETDKQTVYANGSRYVAAAQLSVYMSQAYSEPVTLNLVPKFENTAVTADIGDYVRFSKTQSEISSLPAYAPPAITITANSTERQTIFLYVLRSDENTMGEGNQVQFVPQFTGVNADAIAADVEVSQAGVWINADKPIINTPSATTRLSSTCGDEVELTVEVLDTVADLSDQEIGYEIYFKADNASGSKKLDGTYVNVGESLKRLNPDGATGKGPIVTWNRPGEQTAEIYVVSPISKKKSETVSFKADIAPARTVTIESTDDNNGIYYEGQGFVNFKITLSQNNDTGAPLYAFLVPGANAKPGMFSPYGDYKFIVDSNDDDSDSNKGATKGIRINANNGDANSPVTGSFMMLDGHNEEAGGLGLSFQVKLCTSEIYKESNVLPGYDSNYMNLKVYNVAPVIKDVELNGLSLNGYTDHIYTSPLPRKQTQRIRPIIKDVAYDISNDESADGSKNLHYRYIATCNGGGKVYTQEFTATAGVVPPFEFNFPKEGMWTVKIQARDKDMGEEWSDSAYVFSVDVLSQPQVKVTVPEVYLESTGSTSERQTVSVKLTNYSAEVGDYLVAKIIVHPPEGANPGIFKLDSSYKKGKGALYPNLEPNSNEYYVFLDSDAEEQIPIVELDGTTASYRGFNIEAKIIGDDTGVDGTNPEVLDDDDQPTKWSDYYLSSTVKAYVQNVAPLCNVSDENTNAWEVAGGLARSNPIQINIKSDVDADFAGLPDFPGIKVTIVGCPSGEVTPAQANPLEFYVTESGTFKFIPDFASEEGEKTVTVTVEDKDGGYQTWRYLYKVKSSKFLYTVPNGPGGRGEDLSTRYSGAKGIGQGRIFVRTHTFDNSFMNFQVRWNCSEAQSADVCGYGYKVGDVDNGHLTEGADIAMSPVGTPGTAGNYFTYEDTTFDSYLYGWLYHALAEKGLDSAILSVAPEMAGNVARYVTVKLPDTKGKDDAGGYPETFVEGIFAKEWRPLDNAGDLNQDGIPDRKVKEYGMGVFSVDDGTLIGNDLVDISKFNEDEDYLPAWTSTGNSIIPNTVGAWATQGKEFNAFLEIRGIGEGLNAGYKNPDGSNPAPDYTPNEQRAYLMWKGIAEGEELADMSDEDVIALFEENIADATLDLAKANSGSDEGWSPERPTDPTMEDTDGDGLPDGYEYWFWYAAKVGFTDKDGKWMPPVEVGFRLDLEDLENFKPIDSSDICKAFDPQVNNLAGGNAALSGTLLDRDFDCDGLYDLEEFLIGTNPIHCDTDGDGVPDGYEVMWGLNPLDKSDKTDNENNGGGGNNPDGDAMAWAEGAFLVREFTMMDDEGNDMHYLALVNDNVKKIKDTFVAAIIASKENDGIPFAIDDSGVFPEFKLEEECDLDNEVCVVYKLGDDIIPRKIFNRARFNENDIILLNEYEISLNLIHDQVYAYYGFDPRTGWSTGCTHGFVTGRWCPICNEENPRVLVIGQAGAVVNTRAYTTKDEYLLGQYLRWNGRWVNPSKDTVLNALLLNCTNPNVAFSDQTYGDANSIEGEYAGTTATLASENHGADTDGDGVADGWTLYCGGNPCLSNTWGKDASGGGWGGGGSLASDPFADDFLTNAAEFNGTDVVKVYSSCPSIASNNVESAWLNKFFPTNPFNSDTDGDGIMDDAEGEGWTGDFYTGRQVFAGSYFSFIYTDKTLGSILGDDDESMSLCYRGGGMNPCSVDTDLDGLPDAWERQFAGIIANPDATVYRGDENSERNNDSLYSERLKVADGVGLLNEDGSPVPFEGSDTDFRATSTTNQFAPIGRYIFGGMDATDSGDAYTDPSTKDAYVGTVRDRDFDGDGLENYQEYLIQAVRAWRYDDTITPLMGHGLVWNKGNPMPTLTERVANVPKMDILSGKEYFETLKNSGALWNAISNGNDYYDEIENTTGEFDYKNMGYMAPCDNSWDPAYQYGLTLLLEYGGPQGMRYMSAPTTLTIQLNEDTLEWEFANVYAAGYVSTDPRKWDTDEDGMDDYWEVFHGLNPLLGTFDVIAEMYGYAVTDEFNPWSLVDFNFDYDPIRSPWRMGLPDADPDGDGLRNFDESILGNMTSPSNYHTDPSPLWMTDSSSDLSYVKQFYGLRQGDNDDFIDFSYYPWQYKNDLHIGTYEGASSQYFFSFEETEGYDTDGDWRGDGFEVVQSVIPASDPLNATDPDRRAALYLDGAQSCAYNILDSKLPEVMGYGAYDFFRQFTIECWVKPEEEGREQTIIERGYEYPKSNLVNNEAQWRANFRIGINEGGLVYGLFDNDNAVESDSDSFSTQKVVADKLPLNKWSHIALRFDGKTLSLYINGICKKSAPTRLIPANGIRSISQDPEATVWDWEYQVGTRRSLYPMARYKALNGANTIGARRNDINFSWYGDINQFTDFFKGYVSEVRYWDGPRTDEEIHSAYKTRFSTEDMKENRDKVFDAWYYDLATRNDNDGKPTLPAQIVAVYNFQTLPAAADKANVAQTPAGFNNGVLANVPDSVSNDETKIGWWESIDLKSEVYTDTHIVPWIQNMVSTLPLADGTFLDSQFWSEKLAGYYTDSQVTHHMDSYAIPNGGNPYKARSYMAEADLHNWRLKRLAEMTPEIAVDVTNIVRRYEFEVSRQLIGNDSLVPLGQAFAKLDTEYWDGQGASTAWTDTLEDSDGDGLPDWWENIYGDLKPSDMVDYEIAGNTVKIPASEAYLRDVAKGMQPGSGSIVEDYKNIADMDGDGLVDWWQQIYNVVGGAMGDDDGDALSNYVEYLLSEFFGVGHFSPVNAYSVNEYVSDYFFKVGESYVGEIFTDHDFIDDDWEDKYSNEVATRYVYDAGADDDNDGWSNYAEFQAGTDPTAVASLGVDNVALPEHPVPIIELKTVYEGSQNIVNKKIVVQAWRDKTLESKADAHWTIGGGETLVVGSGSGNDDHEENRTGMKYVGMNPNKRIRIHLSPGSVQADSVKIEFNDPNRYMFNEMTGEAILVGAGSWFSFVTDKQNIGDNRKGRIVNNDTEAVIGEIDYATGIVDIDLSLLPEEHYVVSSGPSGQSAGGTSAWIEVYNTSESYIRVQWNSQPITGSTIATYYLSDADAPTEELNSLGHIKEGKNTFVAFYDLNDDGKYTAGEPFGAATDVDVKWSGTALKLEMTDTSPIIARFTVNGEEGDEGVALTDRYVLHGIDAGDLSVDRVTVGKLSGGVYQRVRIIRTLINDEPAYNYDGQGMYGEPRVVLDKMINVQNESYITEADILSDGNLDLDWDENIGLAADLSKAGNSGMYISNVTYRIVLGNGDILNTTTNNLLSLAFNRWFDAPEIFSGLARPVSYDMGNVVVPTPTFKWEIPYGFNSYTAFKIRIRDEEGEEIWNSGYQPMPSRVRDDDDDNHSPWKYEWKSEFLHAGALMNNGTKFENNKSYSWQITLANARYRDAKWSNVSTFRMSVPTTVADYAVMNVAVRYFGPSVVASSGPVRVQAFTNPDFSGSPAGEGYVDEADVATLSDNTQELTSNASIIGLEAGTYYVRAFIDTNRDGIHQPWESWGYVYARDVKGANLYVPMAVTVGPKIGISDLVKVFIDDCDTNRDNLPDAWEWTQKGNLTSLNVFDLDKPLSGGVLAVKDALTEGLNNGVNGTLTSGLATKLTMSLNNKYLFAMITGTDVSDTSNEEEALAAAIANVEGNASVTPKTVRITAITLPADGTVVLDVKSTAESESVMSGSVAAFYEFKGVNNLTLELELYTKSDLKEGAWELVGTEDVTIDVNAESDTRLTTSMKVGDKQGFYKVILKEKK